MVQIYNPLVHKKMLYEKFLANIEGKDIEASENYISMDFTKGEEKVHFELYDIIHESEFSLNGNPKDLYYQSYIFTDNSNILLKQIIGEEGWRVVRKIENEDKFQCVFTDYPIIEEEYQ